MFFVEPGSRAGSGTGSGAGSAVQPVHRFSSRTAIRFSRFSGSAVSVNPIRSGSSVSVQRFVSGSCLPENCSKQEFGVDGVCMLFKNGWRLQERWALLGKSDKISFPLNYTNEQTSSTISTNSSKIISKSLRAEFLNKVSINSHKARQQNK